MGYRNYIGTIPKREYNKIKKLSKTEFYNLRGIDPEDDYIGPYAIVKEIYEFGKYCDFPMKGLTKKFFTNKEFHADMNDEDDFVLVDKRFMEMVIKHYHEKVKDYYKKMLKDVDENNKETWTNKKFAEIFQHIRSMSIEWIQSTPYNLEHGDSICSSWKYEYELFELVRIYKSFDWKKNVMAYYGY
jgi:effector-binding domain-containing protein